MGAASSFLSWPPVIVCTSMASPAGRAFHNCSKLIGPAGRSALTRNLFDERHLRAGAGSHRRELRVGHQFGQRVAARRAGDVHGGDAERLSGWRSAALETPRIVRGGEHDRQPDARVRGKRG
ncbi:hypothetical protein E1292_21400 [Nonomuraea deserti]|uniref:Uncharacterized protein n=1 Tax=Nonomuraea deserti TaxID=1848322 RepID=A0A4R4VK50_9ACTN|nr:hypothetical protein [Nonomuraea deserti]TDD03253.1 hypothetical protein E1292_21400 [Nonomuraea deserti]